jgi:hypothetical protein
MSRSSSSNSIAIGGTPESEPPRPPSRTKRLSLSFESKRARRTSVPGNSTGNNGSQ